MRKDQILRKHMLSQEHFMDIMKSNLNQFGSTPFPMTIISLDFDDFNYINDLYSYETGDCVLAQISNHIDSVLAGDDIFCRLHADHFLICLQTGDASFAAQVFMNVAEVKPALGDILPKHYPIAASAGILVVPDNQIPLPALIDRANCARKLSKGTITNSFHIYDQKMDTDFQWRKRVTYMMEDALNNKEFEMYLQPKVILKTGVIVGAEALVRWTGSNYGIIYPDRFIPILEQNGFIRKLDFFMLDEACCFLEEQRRHGRPMLPISVNFSKSHLHSDRLVERIFETVNSHKIATHLIEIEFTENTLLENTEKLIEVVSDLRLLGFHVALDDFGSAYSSLNYLKDLPIDIVKVDKGFLDASSDTDRGKIVISKVIELIKSLRMLSVIEGVETEEQVDFMQKMGCDLAQGYFYAKPMTQTDYITYLENGSVTHESLDYMKEVANEQLDKSYLYVVPAEFQMDNWELYTLGKNIDMGLMKGYLDREATVQYVNDRALEYLGYTRQEFRELFKNSIAAFTHPDDVHIVQSNTEALVASGKPLKFQIRAIRKDGTVIILQGRSSCVVDEHGRPVGIYAFQDVTFELEKNAALQQALEHKISELEETVSAMQASQASLRISEERYRIVVNQSNSILFDWDFASDSITFSDQYYKLFGQMPLGTTNASTNPDLRLYIHPDDISVFEDWITNTYCMPGQTEATFRVNDVKGIYHRIDLCSTAICDQNNVPVRVLGSFRNRHHH